MLAKLVGGLSSYALLPARLLIGIVFVAHGWQKLQSLQMVEGFFAALGIPAPSLLAPFVATVELVGGLLLIAGLLTRYAAVFLSAVMLVALFVKVSAGAGIITPAAGGMPAFELDLALLSGLVALLLSGAGTLSVDKDILKKEF